MRWPPPSTPVSVIPCGITSTAITWCVWRTTPCCRSGCRAPWAANWWFTDGGPMSEYIREVILTTRRADGSPHIAPMGVRDRDGEVLIAPFKPSGTLDNLLRERRAVINLTDDVRVYAGCLTGHHGWPVMAADHIDGIRLAGALAHEELVVERVEEDEVRPRLYCRVAHHGIHGPFRGFNRAQAAVLELAILVSRLDMLP